MIEKPEDELCAERQMTEERHSIYKYKKNSFRVGRDQLFVVSWDTNTDECSSRGKKYVELMGKRWRSLWEGLHGLHCRCCRLLVAGTAFHRVIMHHGWLSGQKWF